MRSISNKSLEQPVELEKMAPVDSKQARASINAYTEELKDRVQKGGHSDRNSDNDEAEEEDVEDVEESSGYVIDYE